MSTRVPLPLFGQPDPLAPQDVHLVGRYAVGVTWGDNHGSIYPFDMLRRECGCGACASLASLSPSQAWPTDIKRVGDALHVGWADGHASVYPYRDLRAACRCAGCTGGH